MDIKPIETRYKGYRFRSRLEARWAVFFDALGVKWEYEKEGYDLGDAGWYLPDFWLPEINAYVEIKGGKASDKDKAKCVALKKCIGGWGSVDAILLGGAVASGAIKMFCDMAISDFGQTREWITTELKEYLVEVPKMLLFENGLTGLENDGKSCWIFLGDSADDVLTVEMSSFDALIIFVLGKSRKQFDYAHTAARSARFEHGKSGAK